MLPEKGYFTCKPGESRGTRPLCPPTPTLMLANSYRSENLNTLTSFNIIKSVVQQHIHKYKCQSQVGAIHSITSNKPAKRQTLQLRKNLGAFADFPKMFQLPNLLGPLHNNFPLRNPEQDFSWRNDPGHSLNVCFHIPCFIFHIFCMNKLCTVSLQ